MKEYTLLALVSVAVTVFCDAKSGILLLRRPLYYVFLCIIFVFKLLVNGYLTGQEIVRYNPRFFLGLRMGSIPLEDFLFGFSMVTASVLLWEAFKRKEGAKR